MKKLDLIKLLLDRFEENSGALPKALSMSPDVWMRLAEESFIFGIPVIIDNTLTPGSVFAVPDDFLSPNKEEIENPLCNKGLS